MKWRCRIHIKKKKDPSQTLQIKITVCEIKNILYGINGKLHPEEEKIVNLNTYQ